MESSTLEQRTDPPGVTASTMAEAFRRTVDAFPDRVAVRTLDGSTSFTYAELRDRVDEFARGLAAQGIDKGDTVAIMLINRPEFSIVDHAVMTIGAIPFSLYQTLAPEQIEYVLTDAATRIVVCEQAFLPQIQAAVANMDSKPTLAVLEGGQGEGTIGWDELIASGDPSFDIEAAWRSVEADDLLTLIYTSGTTGPPKGVQLAHRNLMTAMNTIDQVVQFPDAARIISWLPAAHIAERAAHHYIPTVFGMTITTCPDPRQVVTEYLPKVRPHWFFAVPRIWEKLKAGLEAKMAAAPPEAQEQAKKAIDAAIQKVRLEQRGEEVPAELAAAVEQADAAMFVHLRKALGLDEAKAVNVGAAPTPVEVIEFFHAIGIELAELWGMSETCGSGTVNPPGKVRIGTVGPPAPNVEIKIAEDGEVLMRSPVVMVGYRNLPDRTAEAIDEEGWLHTGDIGEFDEEGYLRIVDRKKEIIINAAGKNMSPANIESTVKASSPLIGQACVIGDAKPYNTALIVLDADFAPAFAQQQGLSDTSLEALAEEPAVVAAVQEGIDEANAKLARVEQIKKFKIVRGDWAPGGDELTPTMKLKRKPIAEKYAQDISELYGS